MKDKEKKNRGKQNKGDKDTVKHKGKKISGRYEARKKMLLKFMSEEKYVPMLFYCCAAGQMMIVQKYA